MTEDIEALKREIFEILMGVGGNDLSVVSIKIVDYLHRTGRLNAAPTSEDRQRAWNLIEEWVMEAAEDCCDETESLKAEWALKTIRATLSTPIPVIPAGWKLVPISLTEEMEDAGNHAADDLAVAVNGNSYDHDCAIADAVWKAMLSAAPQPKKEGE